jgi:autotransporter-associated beta strand protein
MNVRGTGQLVVNEHDASGNATFFVGNQGSAELNVSDSGSVTVYSHGDGEGAMAVGREYGASSVNQNGGSVALYDGPLWLGRFNDAQGIYDLSGGTLEVSGTGDVNTYLGWDSAAAQGTLRVGGTGSATLGGHLYVGGNGTGEVELTGGTLNVAGTTYLGYYSGSGTLNLDGGTLQTAGILPGRGTASIHFDGGTLRAGASQAIGLPMTVEGGGATFDTNGHFVGLSGQLSGPGGLTKTGAGTLALAAGGVPEGPISIAAGTLRLDPLGASGLWIDAANAGSLTVDGSGFVSQWDDVTGKAGSLSHADPARHPTLVPGAVNGLPVVHFSTAGTPDQLYNEENYTTPITVLSVSRRTAGANYRLITSTSGNWLLGYHNGRIDDIYFEGWVHAGSTADTEWRMYEAVIPGPGSNSEVYVYDDARGLIQLASNQNGTGGLNGLSLGAWTLSASQASDGDVAEILVYRGVLSAAQRQYAENYLINKWFGQSRPMPALDFIPDTTPVSLTAAGATLDLNGFDETIGPLSGTAGSSVALGTGTLTVNSTTDSTFSGALSGTGGLVKTGSARLVLDGTSSYTGSTEIQQGELQVDGSIVASSLTTVVDGAVLSGNGWVGQLLLEGTLSPGNSPGTINAADTEWAAGADYLWEINDIDNGTAGSDPGWDLLAINGTLDITATATPGEQFTIAVTSLNGAVPGLAAGSLEVGDRFTIVTTTDGVLGFDPEKFVLDLSGLANELTAALLITSDGSNIYLGVVPEPSSLLLLGLGWIMVMLWGTRRFSRRC